MTSETPERPEKQTTVSETHIKMCWTDKEISALEARHPAVMPAVKNHIARMLGQLLLDHGFIDFDEECDEARQRTRITGRLGVVSKEFVADMTTRIRGRQMEMAQIVATKAIEGIRRWDSSNNFDYSVIKKNNAETEVLNALRSVEETSTKTAADRGA
jgi:hypothetical protein